MKISKFEWMYMKYFILIFILFAVVSCQKSQLDDCVTSYGPVQTRTYPLKGFNRININDQFEVELVQDSLNRIEITAGRNMFDGFVKDVSADSVLNIRDDNTCNWVRNYGHRYKAVVHCGSIKYLLLSDNSSVSNRDTLFVKSLGLEYRTMADSKLNIKCTSGIVTTTLFTAGNVTLTGYAQIFVGYMYDVSILDARGLMSPYCYGFNSSPSPMYLNSSYELGYHIFYSGDIYYTGNPFNSFDGKISGTGRILKL